MNNQENDKRIIALLSVIAVAAIALLIQSVPMPPILPIGADKMGNVADWWMFAVTTLLLIVGILQLWMFHRQLRSMELSLTQAVFSIESSMRAERAYLVPTFSILRHEWQSDGESFVVLVSLRNHGRTPAMMARGTMSQINYYGGDKFEFRKMSRSVVAPFVGVDAVAEWQEFEVRPWQAADPNVQATRIELRGQVTYRDIFDHERALRFRLSPTAEPGTFFVYDISPDRLSDEQEFLTERIAR